MFSNEAGLGTAPWLTPPRPALHRWCRLPSVCLFDTIIVCTMTGFAIL
ncbi:MAG: alanine:cation symporter family protein [Bilophila wadsworthia]